MYNDLIYFGHYKTREHTNFEVLIKLNQVILQNILIAMFDRTKYFLHVLEEIFLFGGGSPHLMSTVYEKNTVDKA